MASKICFSTFELKEKSCQEKQKQQSSPLLVSPPKQTSPLLQVIQHVGPKIDDDILVTNTKIDIPIESNETVEKSEESLFNYSANAASMHFGFDLHLN